MRLRYIPLASQPIATSNAHLNFEQRRLIQQAYEVMSYSVLHLLQTANLADAQDILKVFQEYAKYQAQLSAYQLQLQVQHLSLATHLTSAAKKQISRLKSQPYLLEVTKTAANSTSNSLSIPSSPSASLNEISQQLEAHKQFIRQQVVDLTVESCFQVEGFRDSDRVSDAINRAVENRNFTNQLVSTGKPLDVQQLLAEPQLLIMTVHEQVTNSTLVRSLLLTCEIASVTMQQAASNQQQVARFLRTKRKRGVNNSNNYDHLVQLQVDQIVGQQLASLATSAEANVATNANVKSTSSPTPANHPVVQAVTFANQLLITTPFFLNNQIPLTFTKWLTYKLTWDEHERTYAAHADAVTDNHRQENSANPFIKLYQELLEWLCGSVRYDWLLTPPRLELLMQVVELPPIALAKNNRHVRQLQELQHWISTAEDCLRDMLQQATTVSNVDSEGHFVEVFKGLEVSGKKSAAVCSDLESSSGSSEALDIHALMQCCPLVTRLFSLLDARLQAYVQQTSLPVLQIADRYRGENAGKKGAREEVGQVAPPITPSIAPSIAPIIGHIYDVTVALTPVEIYDSNDGLVVGNETFLILDALALHKQLGSAAPITSQAMWRLALHR